MVDKIETGGLYEAALDTIADLRAELAEIRHAPSPSDQPKGWAQLYIDGTIADFSDDPDEVATWDGEGLPVIPLYDHPPAPAEHVLASRHNDQTGECEPVEMEPAKVRELRQKMGERALKRHQSAPSDRVRGLDIATIEACARLIEEHSIQDTNAGKILTPRLDGDREGLHYAVSIRALATATEGSTE